ncbi:MAG: hypothetical protein AAF799_35540 [Myxococcota bacterium]
MMIQRTFLPLTTALLAVALASPAAAHANLADDSNASTDTDGAKPQAAKSAAQRRHDQYVEAVQKRISDLKVSIADIEDGPGHFSKKITEIEKEREQIDETRGTQAERAKQKAKIDEQLKRLESNKEQAEQKSKAWSKIKSDFMKRPVLALTACASCELNAVGHAWILADRQELNKQLEEAELQFRKDVTGPDRPIKGPGQVLASTAAAFGSSLTASITSFIDPLSEAATKAIKRRLQREAVLALVDRLTNEMCGDDDTKNLMPSTCSLTSEEALHHAASGTAQLDIVRAAVRADLKRLPASDAVVSDGLIASEAHASTRKTLVEGLQRGESPMILLRDVAARLHEEKSLHACVVDLGPRAMGYADALGSVEDETAVAAAFIAASVTSPICNPDRARGVTRWLAHYPTLETMATSWRIAKGADANYRQSIERITKPTPVTPSPSGNSGNDTDGGGNENKKGDDNKGDNDKGDDDKGDDNKGDDDEKKRAQDHARASIRFAHALVGVSIASAELPPDAKNLLGLIKTGSKLKEGEGPCEDKKLSEGRVSCSSNETDSKGLRALDRRIRLVESTVNEDWLRVVTETLEELPSQKPDPYAGFRRFSGTLTAIAAERDQKEVFQAVSAAALPAASWRIKQRADSFTASIGTHVGFTAGYELRFGTYGATHNFGRGAVVAPTLFAPIGLDLAWKRKKSTWGLFLPAVDPAAFLQYDASEDGRLPGPRVTTALSPGLAARVSLGESPLSLMVYGVVRPQLRTREATVSGPGATAIQFGAAITWDIPLHIFRSKTRGRPFSKANREARRRQRRIKRSK